MHYRCQFSDPFDCILAGMGSKHAALGGLNRFFDPISIEYPSLSRLKRGFGRYRKVYAFKSGAVRHRT